MAKRRPSGDGMVRKREDGRWEGRIVVGHKQNGEPIFRYVLAKNQKELLDKLHRDLDAFQDVELTEDSRMTLGEWLERWMEDYGAATLRPNTLRSYEQFIRCYIKPYLGNKMVSRVTRMDIQKLYRKLKHEGRVREHPEHGHELSDTMVLRIHAMLHRCLKDAEAAHVVARNPTDGAVVPKASYMQSEAAAKIDRGLGNEVLESPEQAEQDPAANFQPVLGRKRKSGSGCITQINDHLFEGRYSPTWPDGTKHSKCVYAHTREECEAKLKVLIQQMNAERQALRDQARGITPPDKLTKTQKKIWTYMKFHPDVTSYRAIARGAGVTRHTAAKWYAMMQGMLGRAVT